MKLMQINASVYLIYLRYFLDLHLYLVIALKM
jgi:hypothetical protein